MRDHLSPTQLSTWKDCPALYERVYIEGKRVPPSGAMHVGSAFHKGAEAHNRFKVETFKDMPADEILDHYSQAFKAVPESEIVWDEEKPEKVYDDGAAITRLFANTSAKEVQPRLVEQRILVPVPAPDPLPPLLMVLDCVDEHEVVRDYKTKGKAPSAGEADNSEQLTAYALGHTTAVGHPPSALVLDFFVKPTKGRPLGLRDRQQTARSEAQIGIYLGDVRAVASQIQHAERTGLFPFAKADSWKCAERFCGFWTTCPGGAARRSVFAMNGEPSAEVTAGGVA